MVTFANNSPSAFVPLVIFSQKVVPVDFGDGVFIEIFSVAGVHSDNNIV